ncbi:MAG: polyphosphate polymerase domain-containing protein [Deltaproteobacteria bacterium]|nr:polyphosphate polymerase domain-containing protein [Deltaproteobacteria bacterium]
MSRPIDIGRYELKYALPLAMHDAVLDLAGPSLERDPFSMDLGGGIRGYEVHSLYLDTPRLDDFYERLAEVRVRNRCRVRTYGPRHERSQPVFLENKRKLENWVIKARVRVPWNAETWCASLEPEPWVEASRTLTGRSRFLARQFGDLTGQGRRVPVSVVHYEREIFMAPDPDGRKVRLTLDRHVRATTRALRPVGLYDPPDADLIPPDWMVMELKFSGTEPAWMRRIVRTLGLRAVPVSKFGLSVAWGVAGRRPHEVRTLMPRPIRRDAVSRANLEPLP